MSWLRFYLDLILKSIWMFLAVVMKVPSPIMRLRSWSTSLFTETQSLNLPARILEILFENNSSRKSMLWWSHIATITAKNDWLFVDERYMPHYNIIYRNILCRGRHNTAIIIEIWRQNRTLTYTLSALKWIGIEICCQREWCKACENCSAGGTAVK